MVRTELDRVVRDCAQSTSCRFGFVQQAGPFRSPKATVLLHGLFLRCCSPLSRPSFPACFQGCSRGAQTPFRPFAGHRHNESEWPFTKRRGASKFRTRGNPFRAYATDLSHTSGGSGVAPGALNPLVGRAALPEGKDARIAWMRELGHGPIHRGSEGRLAVENRSQRAKSCAPICGTSVQVVPSTSVRR